MDQVFTMANELKQSPDLLPWVVFISICFLIWKERNMFRRYFNSRMDYYSSRKQSDAVMAELIRNNTAALDNNTAVLESYKNDRGETRRMVDYHEKASKERIDSIHDEIGHMLTIVNRIDATVSENNKQITLIEDRTN